MNQSRRPNTATRAAQAPRLSIAPWATLLATLLLMLSVLTATAQEKIIKSHGYTKFGELKYGPDFKHLDYVNPDAPKGGEISVWRPGTFDSFNPYARKGRAGYLASSSIERLMVSVADEPGASYGLIAESIEYPESEDWVIFNLRPEATFSDGSPLTAEDVAFSFDLVAEQAIESYREFIKAAVHPPEILGPHRIKYVFQDGIPRDGMISQMGSNAVFSKKWFEDTGARLDESNLDQMLGSAPYVLDSYDINRRIVYRRNPDYWAKDLPITQGQDNFDTIRVEYFADSIAALEGFKAGAYTFRVETSSKEWATSYDFPLVDQEHVQKVELPNGSLPANSGWVINLQQDKFKDLRVREAIGLMYNFEWTNKTLQFGLFEQRHSFWQGTDLAAEGVPAGAELELLESVSDMIDPALLTDPPVMAHSSGERQLDRRNLRRASALLDEAGWIVGDDGLRRNAKGEQLSVEILDDSPTVERLAIPYVDNLTRLGIDAKFTKVDPAQFTKRRRDREFDIILGSYTTNLVPGLGMEQRFGSEDAEYSLFNPASFADPAADILIDKLIGSKTREDFQASTKALDRIFRATRFVIPTWFKANHWVAYYDQYEHPDVLPPYALGELTFWWYNAEKAEKLKADGVLR